MPPFSIGETEFLQGESKMRLVLYSKQKKCWFEILNSKFVHPSHSEWEAVLYRAASTVGIRKLVLVSRGTGSILLGTPREGGRRLLGKFLAEVNARLAEWQPSGKAQQEKEEDFLTV